MKQRFSRETKLLFRSEYQILYRMGKRHASNRLVIFYRLTGDKGKRLGVTISRKWGNAPERNRFKRVVRAAYRAVYSDLPAQLEMNVHPRDNYQQLTMQAVKRELELLIKRISDVSQSRTKTSCRNS